MITYCRVANTPINDAMRESVIFLFYIVAYEVERINEEEAALKRFKKAH